MIATLGTIAILTVSALPLIWYINERLTMTEIFSTYEELFEYIEDTIELLAYDESYDIDGIIQQLSTRSSKGEYIIVVGLFEFIEILTDHQIRH